VDTDFSLVSKPIFDPQGRDDKVIVFKYKKKKKYQRKLGHRQVHFQ
jgi:ribosomal protein L21